MIRLLVPLATPDLSALAKTLKSFLDERHAAQKPPPTHVELLNLLARAAGLRNFATLKAVAVAAPAGSSSVAPAMLAGHQEAVNVSTLTPTARKALLQFDEARRLIRLQTSCRCNRWRCGRYGRSLPPAGRTPGRK